MNSSNFSIDGFLVPETAVIIPVCILLPIVITALVGNLMVFYAVYMDPRLRTTTNAFILSLAFSDILIATAVIPLDLDLYFNMYTWTHSAAVCDFFGTMYLVSTPASIINLCVVSIDRHQMICNPLRYARFMTKRTATVIIVSVWAYALVTALLPVMGWRTEEQHPGVCVFDFTVQYSILITVANFVIPPFIMTILYYQVYQIARSHACRIERLESFSARVNDNNSTQTTPMFTMQEAVKTQNVDIEVGSKSIRKAIRASLSLPDRSARKKDSKPKKATQIKNTKKITKSNIKAAKSLALIVGVFYFCWYPQTIFAIVTNLCTDCRNVVGVWYLQQGFLLLAYANSAINPFLYAFHNKMFKEAFAKILKKFFFSC